MLTSTFAHKCHQMVSAGHSTIGWTPEGDTIWVSNPERLAREHISQYYDHSSYASWTRALHAHSFRKLTPSTWSHPEFHRDRPEAANAIVRKRPPHRGGKPARSKEEPPVLMEPKASKTSKATRVTKVGKGPKTSTVEDTEEDTEEEELMQLLQLPPLRATASDDSADQEEPGESDTETVEESDFVQVRPRPAASMDQPSPQVAARLQKLREQILREKEVARQLRAMLEQLEAHATRARREELQLRHSVVQLAEWIATTAMAPAVAATALATAGGLAASAAAMSAAVTSKALASPPAVLAAALAQRCTEEVRAEGSSAMLPDWFAALDSLSPSASLVVAAA